MESITTQLKIALKSIVVCGDVMMLCSVILCHAFQIEITLHIKEKV